VQELRIIKIPLRIVYNKGKFEHDKPEPPVWSPPYADGKDWVHREEEDEEEKELKEENENEKLQPSETNCILHFSINLLFMGFKVLSSNRGLIIIKWSMLKDFSSLFLSWLLKPETRLFPWLQADAFYALVFKLRMTTKALASWSAKHIVLVRLQLAIPKEIVLHFDCAQDRRDLAPHELTLRCKAKLCSLSPGLVGTHDQQSAITYLVEGDANTNFFHLQACHFSLSFFFQNVELSQDEDKA